MPQRGAMGKSLRINDQIRLSPIRLIDDSDQQVGIVDLDEAKRRAREVALDLVEVSPLSRPPVCKIMDYGKWKYQQKKKEQKARSHSKQSELKEVRLRPKIDDHDLLIKTQKAHEFLTEGDKVQFTMLFKGREAAHRDLAMRMMAQIKDGLSSLSKVEAEPRFMGRRMTMVLAPDRKPKPAGEGKPHAPKPGIPGAPGAIPGVPAQASPSQVPGATPGNTPASASGAAAATPAPAASPKTGG